MGADDEEGDLLVHAIVRNWRYAPLSEVDRALCEYGARLTHDVAGATPEHLDELRALGLTDRAIHDATQVVSFFNYITRIAEALGVEPEDFITPWGQTDPAHGHDVGTRAAPRGE